MAAKTRRTGERQAPAVTAASPAPPRPEQRGGPLPPVESRGVPRRPPSIQILGLDGHVLANRGERGGAAVPLKELPPYLPKAFVAIEDRRFFNHYGVDPVGLARAMLANVLHRGVA